MNFSVISKYDTNPDANLTYKAINLFSKEK